MLGLTLPLALGSAHPLVLGLTLSLALGSTLLSCCAACSLVVRPNAGRDPSSTLTSVPSPGDAISGPGKGQLLSRRNWFMLASPNFRTSVLLYITTDCGGNLSSLATVSRLYSPGYPVYEPDQHCKWIITGEGPITLRIVFAAIEETTECE